MALFEYLRRRFVFDSVTRERLRADGHTVPILSPIESLDGFGEGVMWPAIVQMPIGESSMVDEDLI